MVMCVTPLECRSRFGDLRKGASNLAAHVTKVKDNDGVQSFTFPLT